MKNIAFLSIYSGIVDRGVETFVFELSNRLSKKYSVSIFLSGNSLKKKNIKIIKVNCKTQIPVSSKGFFGKIYLDKQSLNILFFTLKCLPPLIKGKYDAIIPLNGGWQTVIIRIFTKIFKMKMVISGHAGIGSFDAWNVLFRPDVFIALTQSQKNWVLKLSKEVNVKLIPNGVNLTTFNPKIAPNKLQLKKPLVICASALVPYKRVDLTIRAVARSKTLSLLVLGGGEMQSQIDSLGKRLLKNRYLRLNANYSQMPGFYNAGQIFTLASSSEAFGISYIEAMACNLPVVTTNDPTRQEIIGKAGILTNPSNIKQYAADLKLASETKYRNIPYDQALKYSWNKIANMYSGVLRSIL